MTRPVAKATSAHNTRISTIRLIFIAELLGGQLASREETPNPILEDRGEKLRDGAISLIRNGWVFKEASAANGGGGLKMMNIRRRRKADSKWCGF